jgi:hypothetical protein
VFFKNFQIFLKFFQVFKKFQVFNQTFFVFSRFFKSLTNFLIFFVFFKYRKVCQKVKKFLKSFISKRFEFSSFFKFLKSCFSGF